MVHLIGVLMMVIAIMLVAAILFVVVRAKKGKSKLSRVAFGVLIATFAAFFVVITAVVVAHHCEVVDVNSTTEHRMVQTDGLTVETKSGLIILQRNGEEIGEFPATVVKNMFEVDEGGRIVDQSVARINLTIRKASVTRGFRIFGVWAVVESSGSYPVDVVLD